MFNYIFEDQGLVCLPMLILFEFLKKGGKCTNLTNVVMDVMMNDEGVSKSNIALKLYSFGVHCVDVLTILFYKLNLLTKLWLFGSLLIPLA
jgi:hypothetical protein